MKTSTDLHQNGVFAVKDPNGNVLFDTFASTAYSARSEFGRRYNKKWHAAEKLGYTMHGYIEDVKIVSVPREGDAVPATDPEQRIAELEAIEQPLDVIQAGNGGDFGMAEYEELHRLRAPKVISVQPGDAFLAPPGYEVKHVSPETAAVASGHSAQDLQEFKDNLDIPRSADEWDFYSDKPGAEEAAEALGAKLEELLLDAFTTNRCTHADAVRIRELMYVEMDKYDGIGARDTEPETILVSRIESALNLTEELSR